MPNALETRVVANLFARDPSRRRVTFGGVVAYGLFRTADFTRDDGAGVLTRDRETTLKLATGALALVEGSTVVIHADMKATSSTASYTVRDVGLLEDGLVTQYLLVPAS